MLVGRKSADRIRLTDHDPKNDANLIYYGKTSRGTPVYINRIAARCDSLILTGTTTLHYFAGFGGGRKALIPGVAGYRTCMAGHFLVLDPDSGGKHPNARTAVLEGNPMHEDVIEGCRMVGPDFGLFTLLNDNREIGYVTGGDVYLSHLKACDELMQYNSVNIKEKSDMIIVGCGGFPKDLNLIQAHKSMEYAFNAVREGGVMIFVARCTDGFGNPGMRSWFRHKDLGEFEKALREEYEINGQTAYSILLKALKINIIMVSGLPDREVQDMSMTPSPDLDHALNLAESILGNDYTYHLIPDCSNLLPVVGGGED
jgi:nickel-dependent lactate racemase